MARSDIQYSIGKGDIVLRKDDGGRTYTASWNSCDVILPAQVRNLDEFYIQLPYNAGRSPVRIDGKACKGCMYGTLSEIHPFELPIISVGGVFFVRKDMSGDYVFYSGSSTNFNIAPCKEQNSGFLLLSRPGSYYRYPVTGVDVRKHVNGTSSGSLAGKIISEFSNDGVQVVNAEFDVSTGKLHIETREK